MKLRRFIALLLAFVLLISDSPLMLLDSVWAVVEDQTVSAVDTNKVLKSAAVKHTSGAAFLERDATAGMYGDDPRIDTLLTQAPGEFNKSGEEWVWIAYKVTAAEAGTYTLGVQTNSCKWANFKIPMVVNGAVYTLTYTAKAQTQTAEVTLPAGEHVVTVFWPMPANESEVYQDADWNSYLWCNIQSVIVDGGLTVATAPTAAEVEKCFPKTYAATDTNYVLYSAAMGNNGNGYLEFDRRDPVKADLPYIESLFVDAYGEFNKSGEEWGWFAYKVNVPTAGTYTFGVKTQNCRNAPYKIPLCVNNAVYVLDYEKTGAVLAEVDVALSAGEHTVVMFMPMPQKEADATGQAWVDYPWCNVESLRVETALTVSKPTAAEVEACFAPRALSATDTSYMLWSAAMKHTEGAAFIERANGNGIIADLPYIDSLRSDAIGQFNNPESEWPWFAYKLTVPVAGTYTLGVKTAGSKNAAYAIPLCVNNQVYTLNYTAKAQQATVEVELPAGEYTVVMFLPMPQNAASATDNVWNDYIWCNVESVIVSAGLQVSKPTVAAVEAFFRHKTIAAADTDNVLHSATVEVNADNLLYCANQAPVRADLPFIDSLYRDAYGQFNKSGEEWNWFAYKVSAPEAGVYTLGVKVNGCKFASYKIPLCVNNRVYTLSYSAKNQEVTVDVELSAGEHTVVVFMPMPQNAESAEGVAWNDYPWCNVESLTVDYDLTVSKPTTAEVEACFAPKILSAIDTSYMLWSDAVKYTEGSTFLERGDANGIIADLPYIDSLYRDAVGQFNATEGTWPWFAYKLIVPAEGTYTLGVKTADSKNAAYAIALCVNGKVYTLEYTEKSQQVTAEVALPAGEHTVVMFMPMPQNAASATGNVWNDYIWCNVESMIVSAGLQVTKPTVEAVEACFPDTAKDSVLWQQSVLFVGDSITASGNSWASKIGDRFNMTWTNAAVSGATISELKDSIIRHQLMANAGKDFGYVIMHGGINDAAVQVGSVSDSWNVADFDVTTYAGALEAMFYYAYENFGTAKLGYIINYATPNADTTKWAGTNDLSAHFEVARKVCEKWGISYIDLYSGATEDGKSYSYDILQVDAVKQHFVGNDPTEIHLSDAGYRVITPYIESWMETLTAKESPIPEVFRGKFVNAGDIDKVLSGNFTAGNGLLTDRVYTGMAEDEANLEYLAHAKDMLGDWAFASIAVNALEDGEYTIRVEVSAKNAALIGALVDGQAYTLSYTKGSGQYEYLDLTVQLEAGVHYITVTAAMPENDNSLSGTAWNDYPWTNIASFVVDGGLEILAAPVLENVTDKLDNNAPFYNRVEAEDGDYVVHNNFHTTNEANDKASGGMLVGGAWNSTFGQTFDELKVWLDAKHNAYVEYAVIAPADGQYDIRVGFLAGSNDKSVAKPYIAVAVNGTTYKVPFSKDWNQIDKVELTVDLKKGLNIIRCTSLTTEQEIYTARGWINHDFLDLDKRLTPVKHSSVKVEAEDSEYFNKFQAQDGAEAENASGKVLGGANRKYMTAMKLTLDQLTTDLLKLVPYFCVTVNAPQDGYYPISVDMSADGRLPRGTIGMLVDGVLNKVPYARTDKTTAGGAVDALVYLTKGDHVLTFTVPMPADAGVVENYDYYWCNFDSVTLYNGLTLAASQQDPTAGQEDVMLEIDAGDENHVLWNLYEDKGSTLGGYTGSYNDIRWSKYYIEGLNMSQLPRIPYAAIVVTVAEDGTYTVCLEAKTNADAQSKQIALSVDGVPQTLQFDGENPLISAELTLTKGKHLLIFTSPMPVDAQTAAAAGEGDSSAYPWFDMVRFYLEKGLTVSGGMQEASQNVKAEQTDKVFKDWSAYKDSDGDGVSDYLSAIMDDVRARRVSIEKLLTDGLTRVPHISLTVNADEDGWYDVYATVMANKELTAKYAAIIVDGQVVYKIGVAASGDKQRIGAYIPLTAGEHTIVITAAMPETDAEAQAITDPAEDNWVAMNKAYPWFDFYSVTVSGRLSVLSGEKNPLKDQSVLFVGDSITHSGNSWASKIGDRFNMTWTNAAVSGATISELKDSIIRHQLMANAGKDFGYVIMHGGMNDAAVQVGSVSDSWNVADFDVTTYAGALEAMFYYAYENFGTAKLGYIINYATPNADTTKWAGTNDLSAHFEAAKKVCEKWGISYIDLYSGATEDGKSYSFDILQVDRAAQHFVNNDATEIHLSDEGYRVITPSIEAWMKTLEVKSSPVPEENRDSFVNAGNADKVLSGGFTAGNGLLTDRVYTGMAEDEANLEYLAHAKDMLGDWAFASIAVNALEAGEYTIRVEVSAKNAALIGALVDGQAYTLSYTKGSGQYEYLDLTVQLEAGVHYITVTAAMPENDNSLSGTAWNDYPWTNIASFVVDGGLEILAAPTLADVTAKLDNNVPFYNRVEAENGDYVIHNNYNKTNEDDDKASGGQVVGGAWNSIYEQTFDELKVWLDVKHNAYVEYAVVAPADGEYNIRVGFLAGSSDKSVAKPYIAVIVNGTTHKVPFSKDWNQIDKAELTVTLKEGLNIIRCTSITTEQEVYGVKGWINHDFLDLDKRLTAVKHSSVKVEAEDSDYVNRFQVQDGAETENASGKVLGKADRADVVNQKLTLDQITVEKLYQIPYFSVTVNAPQDGYYPISVGMSTDGRMPRGTIGMLVDGKVYAVPYARTDKTTAGGRVDTLVYLTKGEHIVTFTIPMPANAGSDVNYSYCWCNFDYVTLYNGLVLAETQKVPAPPAPSAPEVEPDTQPDTELDHTWINAGDEELVLSNKYTDKGDVLEDANRDDLKWDKLSLDVLTYDNLYRMPYVAIKVTAAADGYYDLTLRLSGYNQSGESTQIGLLVDGKELHVLGFEKSAKPVIRGNIYLKKGTHTLVFTTPMPKDQATATDPAKNANLLYPWSNMAAITLGEGLTVEKRPSADEIEAPFYSRVEAEDDEYVIYNNYNKPNETNNKASGGQVVGGAWNSTYEQTFDELKAWLDVKHNAYVEYAVVAPADGEYNIRVGFLAGSSDKSVAKPYIAVIVNGTTHKVPFSKDWNQIDKAELTVTLKEGLNIIRCTSITTEQEVYGVKGWINHDFLDIDKRLTAVKHSSVKVEAEDSDYVNRFQVQDGAETENASGKVLGSADRKYVVGLKLTVDQLTAEKLNQVPYFSITVNAPQDGYYPITVNMSADGRMPRGTIGMLVDGKVYAVPYARTNKTTDGGAVDTLVYLTKGEHIVTFTIPMPANASSDVNYSYCWCNFDYVTLYNGLVLAETQKAPAVKEGYVRVEVEDHAMFNQNGNNGHAAGDAYYKSSQTIAQMLANGIDGKKTPFAQLVVNAAEAGEYTLYLGVAAGMTAGCTQEEIVADFVVDVNGKLQTVSARAAKTTTYAVVPVTVKLEKGINVIRLTHFSKDAQCGGTTWIDFDYIEMPEAVSKQLTFVKIGEKLEAERQSFSGYSQFANASYSNGLYLGSPDYDVVDEADITFEKLDPADLGEMPHVTYRVYAEKAGTYTLTVGFMAGMHHYLSAEIAEGRIGGFAMVVNGESKQLIEFGIASSSSKMARMVTVELQEGENEVTFTATLAEYIIDRMPRNDETYRLIWVDHDYLVLSDGLSASSSGGDDFDIEDSDHDHEQIVPQVPTTEGEKIPESTTGDNTDDNTGNGVPVPVIAWILAAVGVACVLIIIILCKKQKKNKA